MLSRDIERQIAEPIYPIVKQAVYDEIIGLVKNETYIANRVADVCVDSVRECYEEGVISFVGNMIEAEKMLNNFFVEGFEDDFSVDSWTVVRAVNVAFSTFHEHMVKASLLHLCDMGYVKWEGEDEFSITEKGKSHIEQINDLQ